MSKILVSGGEDIFAVVRYLTRQKSPHEIIALHPQFAQSLRDSDIMCKAVDEAVTEELRTKAGTLAAENLHEFMGGIDGIVGGLSGIPAQRFRERAPGFVLSNIFNLTLLVLALDTINPDVTVVHNDVEPVTRLVAQWCVTRGKPCLHIPHAIYMDYGRGEAGTDIHDVVSANHLAAAGQYQGDWYRERGMQNIYLTGVPRFDRLVMSSIPRDKACMLLGLRPEKAVIAYFASWRQDTNLLGCNNEMEEAYQEFLKAASSIPNIQVVVKLHPHGGETNAKWHLQVAQKSGLSCVITDKHLDVVLQAMNLGVAYGPSNVLIEAAVLGKTIAAIGGYNSDPEVIKMLPNEDSILQGVMMGLQGRPLLTRFVEKYVGIPDGMATKRVSEVVMGLVGQNGTTTFLYQGRLQQSLALPR